VTAAATLLIDDDEGFVRAMIRRFESAGVPLDTATTWDAGLGLYRVGVHELVVADYNLRDAKHGLTLLAAMKQLRATARLLLISGALTAEAEEVLGRSTLVDRYLVKRSGITDEVLEEAREAQRRVESPRDWRRIAATHIAAENIDYAVVEEIDALLRAQLP
jgi:ActR/RegA family two-component response regulator